MSHHDDRGPAHAREVAHQRQGGRCGLCGLALRDVWEAHHRQRRRESLAGWCPCNVVALHPRCHTMGPGAPGDPAGWAVHDHPEAARGLGLIVPSWIADPSREPLALTWPWRGPAVLTCDGLSASPP